MRHCLLPGNAGCLGQLNSVNEESIEDTENRPGFRGFVSKVFDSTDSEEDSQKQKRKKQNQKKKPPAKRVRRPLSAVKTKSSATASLPDENDRKGGFRNFVSQVFKDEKKETRKRKEDENDSGFLRSIAKRLPGGRGDGLSQDGRINGEPVGGDQANLPSSLLPLNAFDALESAAKDVRGQLSKVRSSELLEDAVNEGYLLSPGDERRRLSILRQEQATKRTKQLEEEAKRQQARRDEVKRRDEARQAAVEEKRRINEENRMQAKKQKEQQERMRKVLEASKQPKREESGVRSPRKKLSANQTIATTEQGERRNPQSVPQRFLAKRKSDKGDGESKFSIPKPFSAVQRAASGAWESVFGGDEEWVTVFPTSRLDPGEVVPVNVAGLDLLVVASVTGKKLYCIANSCAHLGTPLETGPLERRKVPDGVASTSPDGCEDCIVCPLHRTAFALETGEVRGEWCPYPPMLGKVMGVVKDKSTLVVFDIRTRGKNVEVRLNSALDDDGKKVESKKKSKVD